MYIISGIRFLSVQYLYTTYAIVNRLCYDPETVAHIFTLKYIRGFDPIPKFVWSFIQIILFKLTKILQLSQNKLVVISVTIFRNLCLLSIEMVVVVVFSKERSAVIKNTKAFSISITYVTLYNVNSQTQTILYLS